MIVDEHLVKQIESFRKFARYVSGRFGVEIVLEAASAKADANNVIYLPMMSNMSERDILFQYGILLHELGHIKYSDYNGKYDNLITTENHFLICNAIEDARIENLLMAEYDGAIDYFASLYYDFAYDHAYMQKVFGFNPTDTDFWYHLRIYIHNYLVNLPQKKSLQALYGKKNAEHLNEFVKTYKIDEILKSHPVKTWSNVVQLSIPIFEAAKKFCKDKSKNLKVEEAKETKSTVQKDLNHLKNDLLELQKQINLSKEVVKSLNEEVKEIIKRREKEITPLYKERESLKDIVSSDSHKLKQHHKLMRKKMNAMVPLARANSYKNQKEKLENQLRDIKSQIDKIKAASKLDPKEIKKQLKKAANQEKSVNSKIATKERQIAKAEASHRVQSKEITKHASNLTTEQLEKITDRHNGNSAKWEEINKQLAEKKNETEVEKKYNAAKEKIKQSNQKMQEKLVATLKKNQSDLQKQGINMPIMPGFEKSEEWPDSDEAQQKFDKEASEQTKDIVNNGVSFDFGGDRNIMSFVDQSICDVKEFNVLEHFANKLEDNKLDNFNEVINTLESSDTTATNVSNIKHIAVTEKFDKIEYKTNSNISDLVLIRRKNAQILKNLKNIFRAKLRFSKKDHFKGNKEEGNLDTRSLWKLASSTINDKNYFEINNPKFINKVAASIVADVSGSHEKEYTSYGDKVKELMLFLSDALSEVYVKHEVLGIHAPICADMQDIKANANIYNRRNNNLETIVYKRFEDKKNNGIENVMMECSDNSDGESLRIAGKRLLKLPAKDRLLFYITDGKPYLTDCDMSIIDQDLRKTIEWLKENKIKVFAFGFNEDGKKFFNNNFCHIKTWNDLLNFAQKSL